MSYVVRYLMSENVVFSTETEPVWKGDLLQIKKAMPINAASGKPLIPLAVLDEVWLSVPLSIQKV